MSEKREKLSSGARSVVVIALTALAAFALSLTPMSGKAATIPVPAQSWPEQLARPARRHARPVRR